MCYSSLSVALIADHNCNVTGAGKEQNISRDHKHFGTCVTLLKQKGTLYFNSFIFLWILSFTQTRVVHAESWWEISDSDHFHNCKVQYCELCSEGFCWRHLKVDWVITTMKQSPFACTKNEWKEWKLPEPVDSEEKEKWIEKKKEVKYRKTVEHTDEI